MNRKSPNILVMIESSRESGRALISGIAAYSRDFGPWHFHWQPAGLQELPDMMTGCSFDGVLARNISDTVIYRKMKIPVVVFAFEKDFIPGTLFECADDQAISELIASHFFDRGFQNFAFFGQQETMWSLNRERCFKATLLKKGFDVASYMISKQPSDHINDQERKDIHLWLRALPKPVAMMAANDDIGRMAIQLCAEAEVRVPEECAIVGVDNDPVVCGFSNPPLSSVALKQHQAGYQAAAALDKMMKGQPPGTSMIVGQVAKLVLRPSSDVFAVADPSVAASLRYIHLNSNRRVLVGEVAQACGVGRRTLERRFCESGFPAVQHYIRATRADHLANLLKESHLTLEEIAEQCGFSEAAHVSRFFSSVKGETPSAYRKRVSGLRVSTHVMS